MGFYKRISAQYNSIFPLNRMQIEFVKGAALLPGEMSLLDVGCGTGELARELSEQFAKVAGVDLDGVMLEAARDSSDGIGNLSFSQIDMLDIDSEFGESAFDIVNCFGNTLVHLDSPETILRFLRSAKHVLKPGGKLLIQIINYDRILDKDIRSLPTIDTPEISFIRNYFYDKHNHLIEFETILTVKSSGQVIENMIHLYPLRKGEMDALLSEAGFPVVSYYGNFKRENLSPDSIPLVLEAMVR